MDLLDDDGLTNGTLTLSNSKDGTLVIACGAMAREISRLMKSSAGIIFPLNAYLQYIIITRKNHASNH